jgi:hypothetical protein
MMDDFTVVPQHVINTLKRYAEEGYEVDTDDTDYDMGLQDGQVALAQAILEMINVPYTKFELKDKQ